jgi:hypothetical protein
MAILVEQRSSNDGHGVGKSFVACALAHKACLCGHGALYHRLPRLVEDIQLSRGNGRYIKLLKGLSRIEALVLDDWGLARLTPVQQRDLLELLDAGICANRPSSRASSRSITGTRPWPIRRSPMRSWTGLSTMPTTSI